MNIFKVLGSIDKDYRAVKDASDKFVSLQANQKVKDFLAANSDVKVLIDDISRDLRTVEESFK